MAKILWQTTIVDIPDACNVGRISLLADELVIERHRRAATVVTSDRDPSEWLALMTDPLLAQSAIDRLKSAAWELVIEGKSYREREKPNLDGQPQPALSRRRPRRA